MTEHQPLIGLDPTSGPMPVSEKRPALRPVSLDGAVVGLVSNGLGESDALMNAVYRELETHCRCARRGVRAETERVGRSRANGLGAPDLAGDGGGGRLRRLRLV